MPCETAETDLIFRGQVSAQHLAENQALQAQKLTHPFQDKDHHILLLILSKSIHDFWFACSFLS